MTNDVAMEAWAAGMVWQGSEQKAFVRSINLFFFKLY